MWGRWTVAKDWPGAPWLRVMMREEGMVVAVTRAGCVGIHYCAVLFPEGHK